MTESRTDAAGVPGAIGLALSGGGYRAAAFHLGALSYLERRGLLSAVRMISSVSVGTFVGAGFALSLSQGGTCPRRCCIARC